MSKSTVSVLVAAAVLSPAAFAQGRKAPTLSHEYDAALLASDEGASVLLAGLTRAAKRTCTSRIPAYGGRERDPRGADCCRRGRPLALTAQRTDYIFRAEAARAVSKAEFLPKVRQSGVAVEQRGAIYPIAFEVKWGPLIPAPLPHAGEGFRRWGLRVRAGFRLALAHVRVEVDLAQADRFRRDLDQFVIRDIGE